MTLLAETLVSAKNDSNLVDAVLILQRAFKKTKPDSGREWNARATLLHAITLLAKQIKDDRIKVC